MIMPDRFSTVIKQKGSEEESDDDWRCVGQGTRSQKIDSSGSPIFLAAPLEILLRLAQSIEGVFVLAFLDDQ